MKKTEKKVVAFDQVMYDKATSDLSARLETTKYLCGVWNANAILPRMNKEYFNELIAGGVDYFETKYLDIFVDNMNSMVRGQGDAYRENNLRARPGGGYERARFDRNIASLRGNSRIASSELVHHGLIDFDETGSPYISQQTYDALKDFCTAFETSDNQALREAGEALAEAANKAHKALTANAMNLMPESLKENLIMPVNSYPEVIQMSPHTPGTKSLAPVILDRVNGKYVFNHWCLSFGVQQHTPPPPPKATKKETAKPKAEEQKPTIALRREKRDSLQPQKIQSMF